MAHEVRKSMEKDDDGILTREEKEALLDRKIQMMKLKNEERMKKFKEIEEDKKWAEREGRAVSLKNSSTFNDDDDSWPVRTDRFPEERTEEQVDLRNVLQQRRGESRGSQEQPVPSRQQGSSKYASILEDGPPPDPVYNYLADHGRDKPMGERAQRNPRGQLLPRNNGTRGNRPRHNQFPGQTHKYNGDDSLQDENSAGYDHWRKERETIDRERIERQKTKEGWRREWDRDKAENQREQRSFRQANHQSSVEEHQTLPSSSGDSNLRGTSYRGGRGRGRPKQDVRGSSPRAGLTPDREFGSAVQEPPRFRISPEDSRPTAAANSPRNWPNAQRPVTSVQSQQQWPHSKSGTELQACPADSEVMPSSKNTDFSPKNSIVITVGNRPQAANGGQPIIRIIQNEALSRQDIKPVKSEVELLARDQFVKFPKKGIGSGRLLPPSKERTPSRGKSANRKIVTTKGRRAGSRWVENDDEPVTIGIAVITTPGDKEENVTKTEQTDSGKASPVAEEIHPSVNPPKKDITKSEDVSSQIEFVDDEAENYDDDDDEWEDIDGSWADVDEKVGGGEHNKSNESIDRFIEENTLHPDGTNWNIDEDTAGIPWSEQVDAESQERHHMEDEWTTAKQRPSDSNLDSSYQSSCSIVESPFEQSEILSSLLAAASDPFSKEEFDIKPAAEKPCVGSNTDVAGNLSSAEAMPSHELSTMADEESCSEPSKAAERFSNDLQEDATKGLSSESQASYSLNDISSSSAFSPPIDLPIQSVLVGSSGESQFPLVVTEQSDSGSAASAELIRRPQLDSVQSTVYEPNSIPDVSVVLDDISTEPSATELRFAASEPSGPIDVPFEVVAVNSSTLKSELAADLETGKLHQSASETILSQSDGLQSNSEEVLRQSVGSAAVLHLQSAEEALSPESSHSDATNS